MSRRAGTREPPASSADEAEIKQWLARELHDTVSSMLTSMLIQMEQLKRREADPVHGDEVGAEPLTDVREELEAFQESTRQALGNLRRLLQELRDEPSHVTAFVDWVQRLVDRCERRSGIRCRLTCDAVWPSVLESRSAHHLLRIVEEALRNVESHSAARSVDVWLERNGDVATLTVRDDGVGIEAVPDQGGVGLTGMTERAVLVGGSLELDSEPGRGTTVRATFPVERLQ